MRKFGVLLLSIMSIFFLALCIYYYINNVKLQKSISEVTSKAKDDLKAAMARERAAIRQDLEEKYRADLVSFEAMSKRLEIEKKKVRELQQQLANPGQK